MRSKWEDEDTDGWHPCQASRDHYSSHPRRAMALGTVAWEKTGESAIRGKKRPRVYLRIRPGKQCVWRRESETDAEGLTEPYYLLNCRGDGSLTVPGGVIRKRGSLKYLGVTVIVRERRRILL